MLNTLPTSAYQVGEWQQMEKNYRETKNTHTYNEAKKGSKKDPCKPAGTYDMLKKNRVITYKMFILACFGDQN